MVLLDVGKKKGKKPCKGEDMSQSEDDKKSETAPPDGFPQERHSKPRPKPKPPQFETVSRYRPKRAKGSKKKAAKKR